MKEKTSDRRQQLGQQKRALVMHTLFSGLSSPDKVFQYMDVDITVPVAAEKKLMPIAFVPRMVWLPVDITSQTLSLWFREVKALVANTAMKNAPYRLKKQI